MGFQNWAETVFGALGNVRSKVNLLFLKERKISQNKMLCSNPE